MLKRLVLQEVYHFTQHFVDFKFLPGNIQFVEFMDIIGTVLFYFQNNSLVSKVCLLSRLKDNSAPTSKGCRRITMETERLLTQNLLR